MSFASDTPVECSQAAPTQPGSSPVLASTSFPICVNLRMNSHSNPESVFICDTCGPPIRSPISASRFSEFLLFPSLSLGASPAP